MLDLDYTPDDEEEQASYDDEHTASNPYCLDVSCWCHTNVSYHSEVTELSETADEEDYATALSFYGM